MPNKIEFKAPCGVPTVHAVRGYRAKWQCGMISMDFKHPGNAPTVRAVRGARALPHCGGRKSIDFRPPGVCAVCRVALPSSVCVLGCKGGENRNTAIGRSQKILHTVHQSAFEKPFKRQSCLSKGT